MILRPMRDISSKEVAMYAQFHGLETRVRETLGTKEAGLFSIRKLTEEFVTGQYHLQDRGQAGGGSGAGRWVSGV